MPDVDTTYFLLVYDISRRELLSHCAFSDPDAAQAAYASMEHERRGRNFEVVLVAADSLDTVKVTHGAYFGTSERPARRGLTFSLA